MATTTQVQTNTWPTYAYYPTTTPAAPQTAYAYYPTATPPAPRTTYAYYPTTTPEAPTRASLGGRLARLLVKCAALVLIVYQLWLLRKSTPAFGPELFDLRRYVQMATHLVKILTVMLAFVAYCILRSAHGGDSVFSLVLKRIAPKLLPVVGQLSLIVEFFTCVAS